MALFDFLRPKSEAKLHASRKMVKRNYQGASTSRLFADFQVSSGSADADLRPAIIKLRERSRSLSRDNEYVKRYLDLLKINVVGEKGVELQVKAEDDGGNLDQFGNQIVENGFKAWGRLGNCTVDGSMTWIDAQKLAMQSLARDGEIFIVKHRSPRFKDTFAVEFIEPDQIDETYNKKLENGNSIRMGIEYDKFHKPVAYYFTTVHPGDFEFSPVLSGQKKYRKVPASQVIHAYKRNRAGQSRGEPWITPAIASIKQLGGLREAAIINARVGASKMGFFTSPAGDGFIADDMDGDIPIMDADPGSFHQLPAGVSLEQFNPQYPSSEFESFHSAILRGIASALGVSYAALSNDLSSTSYSSVRQGALEERDNYREMQSFFIENVVRPIYMAWLEAAMGMRTIDLPLSRFDKFADASTFRARAWNWIDPQKEMSAAVMGLKNGVLSLGDIAKQYGMDTDELLSKIQRDKALMQQFGVKYALEPYAAEFNSVQPDGISEDTSDE